MSSIESENRKTLMLFSGRAFPELTDEIGHDLGIAPTEADSYEFANGEISSATRSRSGVRTPSWSSR